MSIVGFLWFVVCILGVVRCNFVRRPSNSEAVVGGQVELKCTAFDLDGNFSIEWQRIPVGETRPETINKKYVITGVCGTRCSIEGSEKGEYNLVIRDLALQDAGKYKCMDLLNTNTAAAELVVFEAYPSPQSCTAVLPADGAIGQNSCGIEPDTVQLSCNMSYKGNLKPVMEWVSAGEHFKTSDRNRLAVGDFYINGITLKADRIRDSNYTCFIKYENSVLLSGYSWTKSIRVFSNETREVGVTNCKSENVIDCAVSTGHSCSYSWTNIVGSRLNKMYSGSRLDLRKVPNGLYVCKAECIVRGTICSVEPLHVDYCSESKQEGLSPGAIAGIVISIVLCIIFITVLILIVCLRRRLAGNRNSDGIQRPNIDVELPLVSPSESKDLPGGSGQTGMPKDLTGGKPDILEDICEKAEDSTATVEPEDAKDKDADLKDATSPASEGEPDSESVVDVSEFVFIDINPDSIEERIEHRFPGK